MWQVARAVVSLLVMTGSGRDTPKFFGALHTPFKKNPHFLNSKSTTAPFFFYHSLRMRALTTNQNVTINLISNVASVTLNSGSVSLTADTEIV